MLIQHGTIYDGVTPTPYAADIRLENGKIKEISPDLTPHPGEEVFDAAGLRIYPGFVDAHSHLGLDNYGMDRPGQRQCAGRHLHCRQDLWYLCGRHDRQGPRGHEVRLR